LFTGIVEVRLDRPEAKNAIGKEMLHGLSRVFELINQNSDVNVAMIRSSVPGVFCAGADLKVNYFYFILLNLKWKII
jgi:methylglutaconyl-CoA hydratase